MKERIKRSLILLSVGVVINIVLAIIKIYVGISCNSLTIMLDGTNSALDIVTCIVTIAAFLMLLRRRTLRSRYGYGRTEYLAGFIVALAAAVMGGLFLFRSLNRLAMPEPVFFGVQSCVLISVGVPVKLGMALFYMFVNKKVKSKALGAIMMDSFLDTGITATSLISFAVSSEVDFAADAIFGIVLSVVVMAFAVIMLWDNIKAIVLGDGVDDDRKAIEKILTDSDDIAEVVDIGLADFGYASKMGYAEVVFKEGMQLEDIIDSGARIEENIYEQLGADVKLSACVPQSEVGDGNRVQDTAKEVSAREVAEEADIAQQREAGQALGDISDGGRA